MGPRMDPAFVKTIPYLLVILRNWIITAFCKRMTSENPPASKISPLYSAVFFQCFHGVLGARRRINTVRAQTGWNKSPVKFNQTNQDSFHETAHFDSFKMLCSPQRCKKARSILSKLLSFAAARATTTMSLPLFNLSRFKRKLSRTSLVNRCRTTLFPTRLLTEIPIRISSPSVSNTYMTRYLLAYDIPFL